VLSFVHLDSHDDVVVTGLGMVTPLGFSADESWHRLIAGQTAARRLTADDVDCFAELSRLPGLPLLGAPVNHDVVRSRLKDTRILERVDSRIASAWLAEPVVSMSLLALQEATQQAGLKLPVANPERTSVVFGGSKGGLRTAESLCRALGAHIDFPESNAQWRAAFTADGPQQAISAVSGATAAGLCPVAACATGLVSVLQGAMLVHSGQCDVCIVGSADAALRASVLTSFHRLRVTSRHPDANLACRPFDVSRDGFVIGEGAAVLVLESRASAERRGARPLARICAGGWLNDPTGMTQIDDSGRIVHELLRRVLREDTVPEVIGLHGTGTISNDLAESRGVSAYFHETQKRPPLCFGVKGAVGHLLGAASSVETALTIMALHRKQIPGTTGLIQQDPLCAVGLQSSPQMLPQLKRMARLSLGFGGHVVCGVFD
jgi:3-oxoacyl-[acyl-carrier-protein] synthase II